MKRKTLAILLVVSVSMFASGAWAQPAPQLAAITSDMLNKLQTIPNRATQINALMANPTTKTTIESIAKTKRMSLSQLSAATSLAPIHLNPNISCPNVPWAAGVKFTPFMAAPLCSGPWGTTSLSMAEVFALNLNIPILGDMHLSLLVQRNILPLYPPTSGGNVTVVQKAILPPITGTYIVKIHVIPRDPSRPLTQYLADGAFTSTYEHAGSVSAVGLNNLTLTPLGDGSGFVGIMSTNITTEYQKTTPYVTIYLHTNYKWWRPFLIFGGVTITQL